jgi:hypothetical protein
VDISGTTISGWKYGVFCFLGPNDGSVNVDVECDGFFDNEFNCYTIDMAFDPAVCTDLCPKK